MAKLIETDVPLCKKARKLYKRLVKRGAAYWDGDDSPKSYKVLGQLVALGRSTGFRVIRLDGSRVSQIGEADMSSGRFVLIGE